MSLSLFAQFSVMKWWYVSFYHLFSFEFKSMKNTAVSNCYDTLTIMLSDRRVIVSFKWIEARAPEPWVRACIPACSLVVTWICHLTNRTNLRNDIINYYVWDPLILMYSSQRVSGNIIFWRYFDKLFLVREI